MGSLLAGGAPANDLVLLQIVLVLAGGHLVLADDLNSKINRKISFLERPNAGGRLK
jgi:hypothetical protein